MKSNKLTVSVLTGILYILTLSPTAVYAQSYADFVPAGEKRGNDNGNDNNEMSVDPEIATILESQGMLLNPGGLTEEELSKYTLGITDVIDISVMRHPEVSGQYVINSEGKIQYDFVGDIELMGLTKHEVKELLIDKLSEYIIAPEVTVKIIGYNSKVVYVIGEVGRPGKIFMRGDTITVREALIQAGLPLLSAKMKKSNVITPAEDGNAQQRPVNVHALLIKGDLRENLVMNPGDTLYIPPTVLTKAMRAISPVAAPISTAAGTGRTLTTGF